MTFRLKRFLSRHAFHPDGEKNAVAIEMREAADFTAGVAKRSRKARKAKRLGCEIQGKRDVAVIFAGVTQLGFSGTICSPRLSRSMTQRARKCERRDGDFNLCAHFAFRSLKWISLNRALPLDKCAPKQRKLTFDNLIWMLSKMYPDTEKCCALNFSNIAVIQVFGISGISWLNFQNERLEIGRLYCEYILRVNYIAWKSSNHTRSRSNRCFYQILRHHSESL